MDTPARPARGTAPLDDEWLGLCHDLRSAQRAKLDFLAELGRRAHQRRGPARAPLEAADNAALAELQHAIDRIDERMRRFITDDMNRRQEEPPRPHSMHRLV